jgi:hypothetical protein
MQRFKEEERSGGSESGEMCRDRRWMGGWMVWVAGWKGIVLRFKSRRLSLLYGRVRTSSGPSQRAPVG